MDGGLILLKLQKTEKIAEGKINFKLLYKDASRINNYE